ncbi:DUF1449 domain-containing protein [Streptomyces sp. N2-109]|uniref:DUF1449 domain-containing protein n=1 Tax=Streptomyces gossypii TaxID=2883101 RepID=A0ABT2JT14_9ACTN|nr:DUF1449 domain-containing protein [Streptomyces gossypii]MCT2591015.1 DUF1449 domain-containing protein [Streptomyces gossypii]
MSEFLRAALEFPAVLFSFALVAVVAYWLFVLVAGVGADAPDGGEGIGTSASGAGSAGGSGLFGLGGVAPSIVVSLLVAIAWFQTLAATVLLDDDVLRIAAVPVALFVSVLVTRVLVRPLRVLALPEEGITHREFVGRVCVVRTGRVGTDFGQAEVTADDGSAALVQVRTEDAADARRLTSGSRALIFDYDAEGGFFRVMPCDPALDPGLPPG